LTYAPLCYTCFSLLHCTFLANNSGHDYVMASVTIYSHNHYTLYGPLEVVSGWRNKVF
jgi:hypothetical protein